jgi:hypothetical protein
VNDVLLWGCGRRFIDGGGFHARQFGAGLDEKQSASLLNCRTLVGDTSRFDDVQLAWTP